jgi:hypothetical protein
VLVALPADGTLSLPVFDTVLNGKSVLGSIVGTAITGLPRRAARRSFHRAVRPRTLMT